MWLNEEERRSDADCIKKEEEENASFGITYYRLKFIAGTDFEGPRVNQGGGRELRL